MIIFGLKPAHSKKLRGEKMGRNKKIVCFKDLSNPELIALISIIPHHAEKIKELLKKKEISISDFTTGLYLGHYRETMVSTIATLIKDSDTMLKVTDKIPKSESVALLIAIRRLKKLRKIERS